MLQNGVLLSITVSVNKCFMKGIRTECKIKFALVDVINACIILRVNLTYLLELTLC